MQEAVRIRKMNLVFYEITDYIYKYKAKHIILGYSMMKSTLKDARWEFTRLTGMCLEKEQMWINM